MTNNLKFSYPICTRTHMPLCSVHDASWLYLRSNNAVHGMVATIHMKVLNIDKWTGFNVFSYTNQFLLS